VYGALAALAVGWGLLRGNPDLFHHPDSWMRLDLGLGLAVGLPTGIAIGVGFAWATRLAVRRTTFARRIHVEFRMLFGPLSERDVLAFSALSAVSEEVVFRGALQPAIGLLLSALAFGAIHVGPSLRVFWPWTVSALGMGLLFGLLFQGLGDLSAPIAAHFTVNFLNLSFINDFDPMPTIAAGMRRRATG